MDEFNRDLVLTSGTQAEAPGNLFLGDLPLRSELTVLSGTSNDFSTIKFMEGAFIDRGTLLIGGSSPNGILHIFDLSTYTVSGVVQAPPLQSNNITDLSD